ncbi:hypothetical protein TeGR_g1799 [Tetraparma gracilis]|nr:hypothetical protein TeGR_g1799 [Tetraparma gracilis]
MVDQARNLSLARVQAASDNLLSFPPPPGSQGSDDSDRTRPYREPDAPAAAPQAPPPFRLQQRAQPHSPLPHHLSATSPSPFRLSATSVPFSTPAPRPPPTSVTPGLVLVPPGPVTFPAPGAAASAARRSSQKRREGKQRRSKDEGVARQLAMGGRTQGEQWGQVEKGGGGAGLGEWGSFEEEVSPGGGGGRKARARTAAKSILKKRSRY